MLLPLIVFVFVIVVAMAAPPALACSCERESADASLVASDIVFRGRVLALQPAPDCEAALGSVLAVNAVRFDVAEVWKGEVPQIFTLFDQHNSCESNFFAGGEYLVFASDPSKPTARGFCSATQLADDEQSRQLLGPGAPADELRSDVLAECLNHEGAGEGEGEREERDGDQPLPQDDRLQPSCSAAPSAGPMLLGLFLLVFRWARQARSPGKRRQSGQLAAFTLALFASSCSGNELPDNDCETGDDCAMIIVGGKCDQSTVCLCGPDRVPGNVRDEDEFQRRFDGEVCIEPYCFEQALCLMTKSSRSPMAHSSFHGIPTSSVVGAPCPICHPCPEAEVSPMS